VIEAILKFAISQRIFVVLLVAATAAWGVRSFQFLPIDAVPDITNNQVQINSCRTRSANLRGRSRRGNARRSSTG
jgi:Cu/Ag efflux pump CusA